MEDNLVAINDHLAAPDTDVRLGTWWWCWPRRERESKQESEIARELAPGLSVITQMSLFCFVSLIITYIGSHVVIFTANYAAQKETK